ncbi:MAG: helix-turn-helix domain-containing protein [Verrucomicrobia bacterium]|nr:helix-turn-helix domain-containing protein [Pseudomonadota bacterium]NDA67853.1 helix-turn-helix domain-containing protein [Verrucomicrobiota bacterium]NDB74987.1 helix-turn-helix domain-containing protein [Verrucomicrobiota bacterium]NDD39635.1 helix-turn-helix domain-containing protein [Verrucomicrobiota bacterium]NDE99664.1 helix-turn-helix domain-containing protein [Verrucomicrobiota bacterium]
MLCNKHLDIFELERKREESMKWAGEKTTREAAMMLGVHHSSVARWWRIALRDGVAALKSKRRGRKPAGERILSDDNPATDGLGADYSIDLDPLLARAAHQIDDIEPEAASPLQGAGDVIRTVCAWLVGPKCNATATNIRAHALALLVTGGGVFDDSRIEKLAARLKKKDGKAVTKQALNKAMGELRRLCLDDLRLPLPNLRSQESRARMAEAARRSHQKNLCKKTNTLTRAG